jgi:hypothetical protein
MDKIKEKTVRWHPKTLKISQIPKQGLEYAFLSERYTQIHQLVWCKDFMQDVIFASVTGTPTSIYGFAYDPSVDPPLYREKTRLMLNSYKDANFGSKVLDGLRDFLHQIEKQLKMQRTIFEKVANPHPRYKKSGVYIVNGSKRWMHSPPMISLYTMLLRVGLLHTKGDPFQATIASVKNGKLEPYYGRTSGDNDSRLLKQTCKGLNRIMRHGDRKLFHRKIEKNYPERTKSGMKFSIYTIHDTCGMVGFSNGSTATCFPHWHRFKDD